MRYIYCCVVVRRTSGIDSYNRTRWKSHFIRSTWSAWCHNSLLWWITPCDGRAIEQSNNELILGIHCIHLFHENMMRADDAVMFWCKCLFWTGILELKNPDKVSCRLIYCMLAKWWHWKQCSKTVFHLMQHRSLKHRSSQVKHKKYFFPWDSMAAVCPLPSCLDGHRVGTGDRWNSHLRPLSITGQISHHHLHYW